MSWTGRRHNVRDGRRSAPEVEELPQEEDGQYEGAKQDAAIVLEHLAGTRTKAKGGGGLERAERRARSPPEAYINARDITQAGKKRALRPGRMLAGRACLRPRQPPAAPTFAEINSCLGPRQRTPSPRGP